jgi:tetratricopeptide (TPR) repeat protein
MTQCMILTLLLAFIACLGFSACQHMRSVSPVEARRQAIDLLAQGQHYETRGEYKLALDLFIQAAELSPRPAVFYHLGHCHSALGQYERAIAYYQKALAMAPDYALAKYELSQAEYRAKRSPTDQPKRDPALPELSEPPRGADVSSTPDDVSQDSQQVGTTVQGARTNSGNARISKTVEVHDSYSEPYVSASAAPQSLDNSSERSSPTLSNLKSQKTNGSIPSLEQVKQLLFEQDSGKTALHRSENRNSIILGSFAYHFQKAESFRKKGMYQEAIGEYGDALKLDSRDVQCHVALADTARKLKRFALAQEHYLAALDIAPDRAEICFKLGNLFLDQKRYGEAVSCYKRSVEITPGQCSGFNNLGVAYMKQNDYEKATQAFREAIALNPSFADAYLNMGIIYSDVYRDRTRAIQYFEKYVELEGPRKDEVRRWIGELKG